MTTLSSANRLGYRYIAMMDILGFRDALQRYPILEIVENVARSFSATKHFECSVSTSVKPGIRQTSWTGTIKHRSALFSDTIIVWTSNITDPELGRDRAIKLTFLKNIADFIFQSFVCGVPIRVGVAFGQCYIHKSANIFIGQPIVDAHLVEMAQEWVGGALHPNCSPAEMFSWGRLASPVVEYQIPVKEGFELSLGYALDWTEVPREHVMFRRRGIKPEEFGYPIYADEMLNHAFKRYTQGVLSESVREKYRNAEIFTQIQMEEKALYCLRHDRDLLKQMEKNKGENRIAPQSPTITPGR